MPPELMTTNPPITPARRLSAPELARQLASLAVTVVDVREPVEFAAGHIEGSLNVPLGRLAEAELPAGALVLVCHSGNRSGQGQRILQQQGHPHPVADLEGGMVAWEEAGLPLRRLRSAPLPLIRQVQITAGFLVLLGPILSQAASPPWILLSWFVAAGLVFAGVSGLHGMARRLAAMPWNRVSL